MKINRLSIHYVTSKLYDIGIGNIVFLRIDKRDVDGLDYIFWNKNPPAIDVIGKTDNKLFYDRNRYA
jgi:hypothetical protein